MSKRKSGILLHISSLPSNYGIGDMGKQAFRFADMLFKNRQSYWQVLPLNPTDPVNGNSPYSSVSAFAGNHLFIDPEDLVKNGFLGKKDLPGFKFKKGKTDYKRAAEFKETVLNKAYENFLNKGLKTDRYELFCRQHSSWLDDYALFLAIKKRFKDKSWNMWPDGLRDRNPKELERIAGEEKKFIGREKFIQFLFFSQWQALKTYCNKKGISIIGDMPIYVSLDSAEVWSHCEFFKLDQEKRPLFVSGVPPDYFSKTGQLWGNPVYDWQKLQNDNFSWWISRLSHNFRLFDIVRIDHFRGLVAFWQIPVGEKTAINGIWEKAPVDGLFGEIFKKFKRSMIIAEDLGYITDDVRQALDRLGLAGMKVLIFAFGDNLNNPYLPHNYKHDFVVYTGTHDNNTVLGWFLQEANEQEKKMFFDYVGKKVDPKEVNTEFMRLALSSFADTAIIPMQDVLGLPGSARMNTPSTLEGNWQWQLKTDYTANSRIKKLKAMTSQYKRG